jgi:type I restriction enzyme S subunit
MSKVILGDVAVERRETCKGRKDGYPIVGLEHLTPEEITLSAWDEGSENTFTKVFRKGNVLFGRRRAYLKKAAVAPFDGICSGDITVIEAKSDRILPELLPFIIQNDALFDFAVGKSAGSLSPRVKWEHLKNFEFELPDMEKQKELAALLWAMDDTKKSYQKLIAATDELVKSQFMEQFGEKNYPLQSIGEMSDVVTKGTTPTTVGFNFVNEGVNFIKVENITSTGRILCSELMHITSECHEKLSRSQLSDGDILFSIAGAIGRTAVVSPDVLPANTNQALAIIRLKKDANILKAYLLSALVSPYVENQYNVQKKGIAQINLTLKNISDLMIPIPPYKQQEQFATFVRQSDKSKFELEQALAELTATYKRIISENLG